MESCTLSILGITPFWSNRIVEAPDVTRHAQAAWRPVLTDQVSNYHTRFLLSAHEVITGDMCSFLRDISFNLRDIR